MKDSITTPHPRWCSEYAVIVKPFGPKQKAIIISGGLTVIPHPRPHASPQYYTPPRGQ
jgi:hypothetical protein